MVLTAHTVISPHYENKDWRLRVYLNSQRLLYRSPEKIHKHTQRSEQQKYRRTYSIFPLAVRFGGARFGFISRGFKISSQRFFFYFWIIQRQRQWSKVEIFPENLNSKSWFQELWPGCWNCSLPKIEKKKKKIHTVVLKDELGPYYVAKIRLFH